MNGRLLAIDFGERRIGLAVSDEMQCIARGLDTLDTKTDPACIDTIAAFIADLNIVRIIVGYPFHLNGTAGSTCKAVDRFIDMLSEKTSVPVERVDETFSSYEAESLRASGKTACARTKRTKRSKGDVDRLAACVILQDYLDQRPGGGQVWRSRT